MIFKVLNIGGLVCGGIVVMATDKLSLGGILMLGGIVAGVLDINHHSTVPKRDITKRKSSSSFEEYQFWKHTNGK